MMNSGYKADAAADAMQAKTAQAEWDDEAILTIAEGRKDDGEKPRYDLIPPEAVDGLARVLGYGAAKYAPRNWELGMTWGRVFAAAMRHLWAWWRGERVDPETGMSHLWHAQTNISFLIAYEARGTGTDDRPGGAK